MGPQADSRLDAITPLPRQAFLLTAMEGFDPDRRRAFSASRRGIRRMIETAGREIGARSRTKVVIIEDEPLIAMDLENLVESLGHRWWASREPRPRRWPWRALARPGLVLADIRLADGSSGLDAVNEILEISGCR